MSCQPAYVVRIDAVPLVGTTDVWKASVRPFATSPGYEGFIRSGIISLGDLTQAMCDRNGSPVVNRFTFTVFDPANYWRAKLADPNTAYLTGQEITYLFGSAEGIAAEDVPLMALFRGQILDPSPLPDKSFSFAAESRLGTRTGPYDLDSPVNMVTGQRAVDDGFLGVPRDSLAKRLPALWGEKTDAGTLNEFGVEISMGLCPGVNLGPLPGTTATYLPKPEWGVPQKYLSGAPVSLDTALGTRTYTYIFGARTTDGQWSLSDPLTLTGMPSPSGFAKDDPTDHRGFGTGVELFVVPYTDPAQLAAITQPGSGSPGTLMGNLWVKDGDAASPSPYHHMDAAGDAFTVGYDDNGDDSHYKPFGPALPATPLAQLNAAAGDFWCFLRHPGTITQGFVSDLGGGVGGVTVVEGEDQPEGTEPAYAPIPVSAIGTMVDLGPDGTGLGVTVNGHYYFGMILSGALAIAARDGGFPPRANLCGWTDEGSPALLINQAAFAVQDVVVQMTGGPDGRGSEDGTRLPIPFYTSSPTVPILQTSRFQDVQALTVDFLGTALGYLACIYFGPDDAATWREHWEQVTTDFGFDHFENEHGQCAIALMDDTESPTAGTLLREKTQIGQVLNAGAVVSSEILNLERYQTGYAPIEGTYRSGVLEIRDAVSIGRYGERSKGEGAVTNHKYTDDPLTAADAAGRMVADRSIGPSYPSVVGRLRQMIPLPLGRQYRIQHTDLITDAPLPIYLRSRVISATTGTITLTGRSRTGTYAVVIGDDASPDWEDATDAERSELMFVSDEDGLIDGVLAPRIR